jgi:hypothetical protein
MLGRPGVGIRIDLSKLLRLSRILTILLPSQLAGRVASESGVESRF